MARGTGKFKTKRGGGRNFSKNMILDENGTAVSTDPKWNRRGKKDDGSNEEEGEAEAEENDDDNEDDDDDDDDDDEVDGAGSKPGEAELTRAERREMKKQAAQKPSQVDEEEDPYLINPNHIEKKLNISDLAASREPTRREREQKEKADAKERYWKLHVQGKTEEAKADLSRLAKIRAEREAAQAKRKAEAEAKLAEIEAKKKAQQAGKRV